MTIVTPQCREVEDFCLQGFNGALPRYKHERTQRPSHKPIRVVLHAPASLHVRSCLRCVQLLRATVTTELPDEMAQRVEFYYLGKISKYALIGSLYEEAGFKRRFAAAVIEATTMQAVGDLLTISMPDSPKANAVRTLFDSDCCDQLIDALAANAQALSRSPTPQEAQWARSIAAEADIISASTTFDCDITQRNFGAMQLAGSEHLGAFVTALNLFLRPADRTITDGLIRTVASREEAHLRSCPGCCVAKLTQASPELARSNVLILSED